MEKKKKGKDKKEAGEQRAACPSPGQRTVTHCAAPVRSSRASHLHHLLFLNNFNCTNLSRHNVATFLHHSEVTLAERSTRNDFVARLQRSAQPRRSTRITRMQAQSAGCARAARGGQREAAGGCGCECSCVCGPNLRFEVGFHLSRFAHGRLRRCHCCRIALRHCHYSPGLGIAGSSGRGRGCTGARNGRIRRRCTHRTAQRRRHRRTDAETRVEPIVPSPFPLCHPSCPKACVAFQRRLWCSALCLPRCPSPSVRSVRCAAVLFCSYPAAAAPAAECWRSSPCCRPNQCRRTRQGCEAAVRKMLRKAGGRCGGWDSGGADRDGTAGGARQKVREVSVWLVGSRDCPSPSVLPQPAAHTVSVRVLFVRCSLLPRRSRRSGEKETKTKKKAETKKEPTNKSHEDEAKQLQFVIFLAQKQFVRAPMANERQETTQTCITRVWLA